jgi:hypothetical protein
MTPFRQSVIFDAFAVLAAEFPGLRWTAHCVSDSGDMYVGLRLTSHTRRDYGVGRTFTAHDLEDSYYLPVFDELRNCALELEALAAPETKP